MSSIQSMHYKQKTPEETVRFLQSILRQLGIEVTEEWQDESSIGTFALRLNIKGTNVGTNGKGVSRAYAQASAYAEFFERYQNEALGPRISFGDSFPFLVAPDEKIISTRDLVSDDNSFMKLYFKTRNIDSENHKEKEKNFSEIQKSDMMIYGLRDQYVTLPFYSLRERKLVYLPKSTFIPFYGSNGMSAGNSAEEALVQGIAEIVERVVQKRIFIEKPTFPDVPMEYIEKYPYVYKIIMRLRDYEKNGFKFWVKDCSFGGKYPVVALIVYECNTGRYGIKLGCHPDYGVAIERTLTEATQGQDIGEYAKRSIIDFNNHGVDNWSNICNSYKFGQGQYPYQLFGNNPTYQFTPARDVSNLSNKEILKSWVFQFIDDGYDVLIRDVSYCGFPSYQIIIPGLSEMMYPDDRRIRAINSRYFISDLIRNYPEKIDKENCKLIIATMNYFLSDAFENTMSSYYGIIKDADIPCENIHCGCSYMISMCYAMIEDFKNASKKMELVLKFAEKSFSEKVIDRVDYDLLIAIKYYFDARENLKTHEISMEYLRKMFNTEIVNRIDSLFSDLSSLIIKQYPGIKNGGMANKERYAELYEIIYNAMYALHKMQTEQSINQIGIDRLFYAVD